jgi:hypothetical protein
MTSRDFVIWLRGFTEACNDYTATPKQWDRIKEVLEDVEDYDDNPGIDVEIDNYKDWFNRDPKSPLTGTVSGSSFSVSSNVTGTAVWNDQMGTWHYTNYPEGFGYYTNSTTEGKNKKEILND